MRNLTISSLIVGAAAGSVVFPKSIDDVAGRNRVSFDFSKRLINPQSLGFPVGVDPVAWCVAEWNSSIARRTAALEKIGEATKRTIAEVVAAKKTSVCLDLEILVPPGTFDWFSLGARFERVGLQRALSGFLTEILSLFRSLAPTIDVGIYNLPTTEYYVVRSSEPFAGGSHRERRLAWFETNFVDCGPVLSLAQTLYPSVYLSFPLDEREARAFVRETVRMCRIIAPGTKVSPVFGVMIGDYVGDRAAPLVSPEITWAMLDECGLCGVSPSLWAYCPGATPPERARTADVQRFIDSLSTRRVVGAAPVPTEEPTA